jgi:hypothetical protein
MRPKSELWGRLAAIAVIVSVASFANGAEQTSTSTATAPKKPSAIAGKFLVQTAGTMNQAGEKSSSGLYLATAGYKIPLEDGALSASASIGYQRQYSYEGGATQTLFADEMPEGRAWDWVDPRLSFVRTQEKALGFESISYGVKGTLAGLSYASERKTQVFSAGPSFSFTNNVGAFWGNPGNVTWISMWDYRYVHHNYKTQNTGKINSPHVFLQNNILNYRLGSRSDLALFVGYLAAYSYQNVLKSALSAGLEFNYVLSDQLSTALGVGNDTTGFAADGQSRELNFFNADSATFYFNLELTI